MAKERQLPQEVKDKSGAAGCSAFAALPRASAVGYKRRQYDRSKTHGPLPHWNDKNNADGHRDRAGDRAGRARAACRSFDCLPLQGRRPRSAASRCRQEGRHAHLLYVDADAGIGAAVGRVREEVWHQGQPLARHQRPGDSARDHGSARQPQHHGRGRDQRARGRGARARGRRCRIFQSALQGFPGLGAAGSSQVDERARQSLDCRLQHQQGEARGHPEDL